MNDLVWFDLQKRESTFVLALGEGARADGASSHLQSRLAPPSGPLSTTPPVLSSRRNELATRPSPTATRSTCESSYDGRSVDAT